MTVTAADTSAVNSTESVTIQISEANREQFNVMQILQLLIVSVGIIGNLTVIVVFMNHRKLRRKIPNRFIVNQVSYFYVTRESICHSCVAINKHCLVSSNKPDNKQHERCPPTKTLVGIRPRTCAFKATALSFQSHDFQCRLNVIGIM